MTTETRHVFGPVPSRRLGRSLGVDLVPHKTCSYDCIYCQLGPTTNRTLTRRSYVSISGVLAEIARKLSAGPPPDYITLSGSGEPTLQLELDALILGIRHITSQPIAVLTNGSLLWRDDVQAELLHADLVIPSLDAGDADTFQCVNRPHAELRFDELVNGLVAFRRRFAGRIWLEVFLLDGVTTTDDQLDKLTRLAHRIAPDQVQLNTVARPPSEPSARAASMRDLEHAARRIGPPATVIAECPGYAVTMRGLFCQDDILDLLRRRPCTLDDLARGLGAHRLEVAKHLERLLHSQEIIMLQHGRYVFYSPSGSPVARSPEPTP